VTGVALATHIDSMPYALGTHCNGFNKMPFPHKCTKNYVWHHTYRCLTCEAHVPLKHMRGLCQEDCTSCILCRDEEEEEEEAVTPSLESLSNHIPPTLMSPPCNNLKTSSPTNSCCPFESTWVLDLLEDEGPPELPAESISGLLVPRATLLGSDDDVP